MFKLENEKLSKTVKKKETLLLKSLSLSKKLNTDHIASKKDLEQII